MSNSKFRIILLNIIFSFLLSAQAQECADYFRIFDFAQSHQISTQQFGLVENLASLEISASDIENVFSKSDTLLEVSLKLAEIEQAGIPLKTYLEIKKILLKERQRRKELEGKNLREQEQILKDSIIDGRRVVFHLIEPGDFEMGPVGRQKPAAITKAFELMATQTTQVIWRAVVELVNKRLPGRYEIKVDPSEFKGDLRPVESVSDEDIQIWINALNELSQLGEPALEPLIVGHKKGDVYRLPTEGHWEFVIRGRGQYKDEYHFGNKESDLEDYAWSEGNSGRETHPVAQKKPLLVDGKEFFDMHGNVLELMVDRWDGRTFSFLHGVDPIGKEGTYFVARGGSWMDDPEILRSSFRTIYIPGDRRNNVGFRLLRIAN